MAELNGAEEALVKSEVESGFAPALRRLESSTSKGIPSSAGINRVRQEEKNCATSLAGMRSVIGIVLDGLMQLGRLHIPIPTAKRPMVQGRDAQAKIAVNRKNQ